MTAVGGLTHRHVDTRSGVPRGHHVELLPKRGRHCSRRPPREPWIFTGRRVEMLQASIGPISRDTLKAIDDSACSIPTISSAAGPLARFELFMESTRREELRPLMKGTAGGRGEVGDAPLRGRRLHPDPRADRRAQQGAQRFRVQQPHRRTRTGQPRCRRPGGNDC